jgi:hypothetical protein
MEQTADWFPLGFAEYDDLSAVVSLATTAPTRGTAYASLVVQPNNMRRIPNRALINIEDADVRFHDDGSVPTSTAGSLIEAGEQHAIEYGPESIRNFKIIETSAGAKMKVKFYL